MIEGCLFLLGQKSLCFPKRLARLLFHHPYRKRIRRYRLSRPRPRRRQERVTTLAALECAEYVTDHLPKVVHGELQLCFVERDLWLSRLAQGRLTDLDLA